MEMVQGKLNKLVERERDQKYHWNVLWKTLSVYFIVKFIVRYIQINIPWYLTSLLHFYAKRLNIMKIIKVSLVEM